MSAASVDISKLKPGQHTVSDKAKGFYVVCIFIGALTMAFGLFNEPTRIWPSFLTSYFYFACLGLGGLFFTAIQFLTKAGWSVTTRRVAESMTSFIPWIAVGAVALLFGAKSLYIWLDHDVVSKDYILEHKASYLNWNFFIVRLFLFVGLWMFFRKLIIGNSLKQDAEGGEVLYGRNVKNSIAFVLTFAISFSLFCVDLLMSLAPHWFSTMFGVYGFAGLFQSSLAMMIIVTVYLMKKGHLNGFVNENHLHDLGKFLKAFTVFMAYIGFSQFMLIWYANIPEETEFFLHRAHGSWMLVSLSLLFFKFVVPFLLLLPQATKRDPNRLKFVAYIILVMQYVDIYWLIYPNFNENHLTFGFYEVGVFLGFLGLFLMGVHKFLSTNSLIPMKDPFLKESVNHHVEF